MDELLLHSQTRRDLIIAGAQPSHATMIIGSKGFGLEQATEALIKIWGISSGDTVYVSSIDDKKINTEQVREMRKLLQLKNKQTVAFVLMATQGIEIVAQNVLLKDMENGHDNLRLILATTDENTILPTVRSRMRRIRMKKPEQSAYIDKLKQLKPDLTEIELQKKYYSSRGEFYSPETDADDLQLAREFLGADVASRIGILNSQKLSSQQSEVMIDHMSSMTHAVIQTSKQAEAVKNWAKRQQALLFAKQQLQKNANARLVFLQLMVEL